MSSSLAKLSDRSLQRVREALQSGLLKLPISSLTLARLVPQEHLNGLVEDLRQLQASGLTPPLLADFISVMQQQRHELRAESGALELVMTGPEPPGSLTRDTAVVVRQMFGNANHSICIAGFAVYQGKEIFSALANRMKDVPNMTVRMYLNIERAHNDTSPSDVLIARFANRFRETQWPDSVSLPDVYFDPRPLDNGEEYKSACLHAKFVVADHETVFLSSANFTEAAQQRNIEAGVLTKNKALAGDLESHFQALADSGNLRQLKWRTVFAK